MEDCDTLLIVGSSFPYIEFMPKPGQAKGVQIELDPKRIGLRYPVDVGLVGDKASSLRELIPLLRRKDERSFLNAAQALHFAESLARGEPNRKKIALTALSDRVRELI